MTAKEVSGSAVTGEDRILQVLDDGTDLVEVVRSISEGEAMAEKEAFYVVDLGDIVRKHLRWLSTLPRVRPFYAVKCNSTQTIVHILATLGAGFDCASKEEIALVQSIGVSADRIIYANPCKQASHLRYAAKYGVDLMTFDSDAELHKIARINPNARLKPPSVEDLHYWVSSLGLPSGARLCWGLTAKESRCGTVVDGDRSISQSIVTHFMLMLPHPYHASSDPFRLVLRILTNDSRSVYRMSNKFGVSPELSRELLETAFGLGLLVVGVSFHVGSICNEPEAFAQSIADARRVFNIAADLGVKLTLLDIGGGFPGYNEHVRNNFDEIAAVVNSALDTHFPAGCGVNIISEPGRYYVMSAFTLATNVIGKKTLFKPLADGGCTSSLAENGKDPGKTSHLPGWVKPSSNGGPLPHEIDSLNDMAPWRRPRAVRKAQVLNVQNDFTFIRPTGVGEPVYMYYMNDGIHGSFQHVIHDIEEVVTEALKPVGPEEPVLESSLWGPSCDGYDCVVKRMPLPEMHVDDWLLFRNMGAYTLAMSTEFNGFRRPMLHYVIRKTEWTLLTALCTEDKLSPSLGF
ncbi:ornithine decarboxylase-like [Petromyzon marinus]|uniref:ornithine decarboxylase-like n=1 Tax=Petromyzon marinus TaxID=7757 RepID=UPI003F72EE13